MYNTISCYLKGRHYCDMLHSIKLIPTRPMISATIRTPVEIWTRILKYAIHVPVFFDVDPIESHGVAGFQQYYWELPYWAAERHRNSFRRVCSSWDLYLSKFNHRYIRLSDIVHGVVPDTAFPDAIRVNIDHCDCRMCTASDPASPTWVLERATQRHRERLVDGLIRHGPYSKLKIVHGDGCNSNEIALMWQSFKLQSVVSSSSSYFCQGDIVLPDLRVLISGRIGSYYSSETAPSFPSLTTLGIQVEDFSAFTGLRLGALKHLSVSCDHEIFDEQEFLIEMLKRFGSQLETFYWTDNLKKAIIPGEIWTLCPKILQIQTPYKWGHEPPPNHPVRCVRLTLPQILYWNRPNQLRERDFREYLPISIDGRFEERGVMLACHWSELLFSSTGPTSTEVLWEAMDIAAHTGIAFVDLTGLYLEEYVSTFLINVWRRVMRRRTYRDNEIYVEPLAF